MDISTIKFESKFEAIAVRLHCLSWTNSASISAEFYYEPIDFGKEEKKEEKKKNDKEKKLLEVDQINRGTYINPDLSALTFLTPAILHGHPVSSSNKHHWYCNIYNVRLNISPYRIADTGENSNVFEPSFD